MTSVIFLPFIITLFFFAWIAMVWYVLPKLSGWSNLAEKYGTDRIPEHEAANYLRIWYCKIGWINYRNVVRFYEVNDGLLLSLRWLFRGRQKNILIPWSEFKEIQERKILFIKRVKMVIGNPQISSIELFEKDFLKIKHRLNKLVLPITVN